MSIGNDGVMGSDEQNTALAYLENLLDEKLKSNNLPKISASSFDCSVLRQYRSYNSFRLLFLVDKELLGHAEMEDSFRAYPSHNEMAETQIII